MINKIFYTATCAITGGMTYSLLRRVYDPEERYGFSYFNVGTVIGGLIGSYYIYCGRPLEIKPTITEK